MEDGPNGPMRDDWLDQPSPDRLALDHPHRAEILDRHRRACASGLSTYLDPVTGFTALTARYLAERGYCCGQACRHCPWDGARSPRR